MDDVKYTSFRDIPEYTGWGTYATDMGFKYVYDKVIKAWTSGEEHGSPLNMDPDFQRGHVWNNTKKSRWVEHILRNGMTGRDIFLNHPGWMNSFLGDFVVVDGKQRLDAVAAFMENKVKAFGTYYKDYTDRISPGACNLRVHINDLQTREEVLQWYLDLNTGGVVHTTTEIKKVRILLDEERKGK